MSQTIPAPAEITLKDFDKMHRDSMENRLRNTRAAGLCWNDPESAPLKWYDQAFEREITPAGTVACGTALRVGATQNGLDVILVANINNEGPITAAANATVTFTFLQADARDGEYTEVGPTICVKAPKDGIAADPGMLFFRAALGNFRKPWLKVKLAFEGTITGGMLDCVLSYAAR